MKKQSPGIDKFTALHFAVGALAGKVGVPVGYYTAAAIVYEIWEQKVETKEDGSRIIFKSSPPESPLNVAVDIGVGMAGYYLAKEFL